MNAKQNKTTRRKKILGFFFFPFSFFFFLFIRSVSVQLNAKTFPSIFKQSIDNTFGSVLLSHIERAAFVCMKFYLFQNACYWHWHWYVTHLVGKSLCKIRLKDTGENYLHDCSRVKTDGNENVNDFLV